MILLSRSYYIVHNLYIKFSAWYAIVYQLMLTCRQVSYSFCQSLYLRIRISLGVVYLLSHDSGFWREL